MFDLRFLADMNISPLSIKRLQDRGWDIFRVSEFMEPSAKDTAILEFARQENRVIITQDLDFSKLEQDKEPLFECIIEGDQITLYPVNMVLIFFCHPLRGASFCEREK